MFMEYLVCNLAFYFPNLSQLYTYCIIQLLLCSSQHSRNLVSIALKGNKKTIVNSQTNPECISITNMLF